MFIVVILIDMWSPSRKWLWLLLLDIPFLRDLHYKDMAETLLAIVSAL